MALFNTGNGKAYVPTGFGEVEKSGRTMVVNKKTVDAEIFKYAKIGIEQELMELQLKDERSYEDTTQIMVLREALKYIDAKEYVNSIESNEGRRVYDSGEEY